MSETRQHIELTKAIISYVQEHFGAEDLALLTDLPGSCDKPPRVYGFVPDVFANNAPQTLVIIGEAKTAQDLATDHSKAQICEFIRFLAAQSRAVFILAVPWPAAASARQMVEQYLAVFEANNVRPIILDGMHSRAAAGRR